MATKKQPEKQYIMFDPEGDLIALGNWKEIEHALMEFEGDDEDDQLSFSEWLAQCLIHELGVGKKIKYTPYKFELK